MRNGRGSAESRNDPVKRQMILRRQHYDKFLARHKMLSLFVLFCFFFPFTHTPPFTPPISLLRLPLHAEFIVNEALIHICPLRLLFNLVYLQLKRPLCFYQEPKPVNVEFYFQPRSLLSVCCYIRSTLSDGRYL